jgi:hypothetical protein
MPVVPLAIMAGGAIISHYAAKKAKADAIKRSPEEMKDVEGGQGAAATSVKTGTEALATGAETQKPATSYFDTLLHGNRAQQSQATAAPTAKISDVYSGAQRGLEQQGVRGAAKDVASANLNKDRASSISGLVTGVQPEAANTLTRIGENQQNRGAGQVQGGGGTYSNLLGAGQANRVQANAAGTSAAASVGSMATSLAKMYSGGGGGE